MSTSPRRQAGPPKRRELGDIIRELATPSPTTEAAQNHVALDGMKNARVDQAPPPDKVAAADQHRRTVAPKPSEMDPNLSDEGKRRAAARQRETARSENVYGRSVGPSDFSPLAGRRGVADSTPLEQLTPEQRQKRDYHLYQPEVPHLPGTGRQVWDQTLNDGAGGYADRAPDAHKMAGGPNATLEGRAQALGIDHRAYPPDARPQLEADVAAAESNYQRRAKNFDAVPVAGGGHKWVPNKYTTLENDRQRSEQFLTNEWAKFQKEGKAAGMTFQDFKMAYYGDANKDKIPDPLEAGSPESHIDRVRRLRGDITNDLRANRAANTQNAIETRARQDNTAARLGVHRGHVMFHDDLQNARNPEELIRTLIAYHGINPDQGLGNMAAMVSKGESDERIAGKTAEIARQRNMSGFDKSQQAAASIGPINTPEDLEAWGTHYDSQGHAAATPQLRSAHIVNNTTSAARKALQEVNQPGQMEILRKWTEHFMNSNPGEGRGDYDKWLAHLGQTNSPRMRALWERLSGQGVRYWSEWVAEGLGGGAEPTAHAGGI